MEVISLEEGDKAFDEAVLMVQQQIVTYQERTSKKLQKLESTIEVARKLMIELLPLKAQKLEGFVNPFDWQNERKSKCSKFSNNQETGNLQHLKLRFPKFEGAEVFECSLDYEHQLTSGIGNKTQEWPDHTDGENAHASQETYTMKPIYDEKPVKSHKCWPDQRYTQSKACADLNEMVKRRNQPRISADSSVSTRTGDSLKFGKVTNLQGTSQTYEAREVIKLSPKQQEDMFSGGFCPYCHDKEGPSHECIQQGQFVMAQKAEMSSLEKSEITSAISENQIVHSVPHLELSPPKFQGTGVFDSLQECGSHWQADPIYDDASVYDDDPEKGQECWLEQEFISAALRGNNFYSSNLLQFEFCTSKRGEEKQGDVAEESSIILTTLRELSEDVPCRDGPTTPTYVGSEKNSSYPDKQNLEGNSTGAKLFARNTKRKIILVAENEIADGLNNSINLMEVSEVESAPEAVFSIISSSMRKRATNSYGLGKTSHFSKTNWLVFDPGGHNPPLQFKGFCNTTITKLPNEGTMECASNCSDYKFKLNEEEIQVEGWKVELPEWNLILGVQWWSQLGELHYNYGMQPMQFEWHGKKLKLISDSILDLVGSCHHFTAIIPRWIEHICGSYEVDEKQDANEEVFSIITTNMGRSAEAFEKFPTSKNSSNFKTDVYIFDPGGRKLSSEDQP